MTATIPQTTIRDWMEQRFSNRVPKLFLELGAHRGEDTSWLATFTNACVIAFEPDPRNIPALRSVVSADASGRVTVKECAISSYSGTAMLQLSETGWGKEWTFSSSLRKPKNHLTKYPVTFGKAVAVNCITLDEACAGYKLIDFIWCDIQGSEGDMIRGGKQALAKTRFVYAEYSNEELYEGQPTAAQLLEMLGPDWCVGAAWPTDPLNGDVLFVNTGFIQ